MAGNFIRKFFSVILKIVSLIFVVALIISVLSIFISPDKLWPLSFFGISFPVLFVINLFILIYYLFKLNKFLFIPLFSVIIGFIMFPRYVQFGNNEERFGANNNLKLMTYNVHVFGRWQGDYDIEDKIQLADNVFSNIKNENPDIICFQEFYSRPKASLNNKNRAKELGYKYSAASRYLDNEDFYSIITYSKFPIVQSGTLKVKGQRKYFAVYADIKLSDSSLVRVYNLHLHSIKITKEKELFGNIPDLSNQQENEKIKRESLSLIKKLKYAFENRSHQADLLVDHIKSTKIPVIIAGDFNDTPVSYAYQKIKADKKDVFIQAGEGMGISYQGGFPLLRIDYVLVDKGITSLSYKTLKGKESDHKAVVVELSY